MKLFLQTVCLTLALILVGCANFPIEGSGTPEIKTQPPDIIHGSFYGFKWKDYDIKKAHDGLGLYQVIYHTNYLYSAAAVLTLGLYVPQKLEWRVQTPPQKDYNGPLMPSRNSK